MSVWLDYLLDKKENNIKMKIYTKIPTKDKNGDVVSRMLFGYIENVDEDTIELRDLECIIERTVIGSIKPDDGRGFNK